MADPLSLLRQFNVNKREIVEKNGMICFGEYCWAKNVKTNYLIYSSSRDGPNKSYYTLECLLHFLKNIHLQHPTYVKQAASLDIPVVQRPDRKDLLAYLSGETNNSTSIDKSAPIELPKSAAEIKAAAAAAAAHHQASAILASSAPHLPGQLPGGNATNTGSHDVASLSGATGALADHHHQDHHRSGGEPPNKLARLDEMEKVRKQFAARLDAPKIKKQATVTFAPTVPADKIGPDGANASGRENSGSSTLRDSMSSEQIAALKAKRLAKKRSTIIDAEPEADGLPGAGTNTTASVHSVLLQYDSNFTKEIQNKERVWRNRSNILQSTGKNFQKTVFPILQTIKIREEGGSMRKAGGVSGGSGAVLGATGVSAAIVPPARVPTAGGVGGVNQSNGNSSIGAGPVGSMIPTIGQPVPLGQAQGAGAMGPGGPAAPQQYNRYDQERFSKNDAPIGFRIDTTSTYHGFPLKSVTDGSAQPKAPLTGSSAAVNGAAQSGPHGDQRSTHHQSPHGGVGHHHHHQKPQKRVSRTPIIIIPATNTSLITMYNAKAILQDLKFIDSKSCEQRRESDLLIQRRKADSTTVPYRIIDNPLKLAPEDWNRVVAVFVQGPAWQFKGWPWEGNPVEIFARIKAFHLKFDEMKLDNNVAKWSVEIIELSRSKRHLDRANLLKFWSLLDQHIMKHKHNIVRY